MSHVHVHHFRWQSYTTSICFSKPKKKKSCAKSIREIFPTELSANLLKKVPDFQGPWVWYSTNRFRMFFIQTLHTTSKHAPTEHGRYYIQTSNSQPKLMSSLRTTLCTEFLVQKQTLILLDRQDAYLQDVLEWQRTAWQKANYPLPQRLILWPWGG